MGIKQTLGAIVLAGAMGLSGCSEEPTPEPSGFVEGEITRVGGNLVSVVKNPVWNGLVSYSNETLKFGNPSYTMHVKTPQGEYSIQVDPTDLGGSLGPQTIYNLAETLEPGMRVRFPTELYGRGNPKGQPMGFSKGRIGMLDPDDIEVLRE